MSGKLVRVPIPDKVWSHKFQEWLSLEQSTYIRVLRKQTREILRNKKGDK